MKEIWKLLELLNEYEPYIASDGEHRDNLWGYAYQWHSAVFPKEIAESYIISKSYWFIQWLVENEKIKLWAYDAEWCHFNIHAYLDLLMLLAIQDEPIKFLCEILK